MLFLKPRLSIILISRDWSKILLDMLELSEKKQRPIAMTITIAKIFVRLPERSIWPG